MSRQNISPGAKWEPIIGYSRAVRIDRHIWVAETTGSDETGAIRPACALLAAKGSIDPVMPEEIEADAYVSD